MSLGNVTYTRVNEDYFRQAIYYLRRASNTPGYPLPAALATVPTEKLQLYQAELIRPRYLDDYSRFVD